MNSFHQRANRFGVIFNPSRVGSSPIANSRLRPIHSSLLTLTFSSGRAVCELARSGATRVPEPFVRPTLKLPGSLKEMEDILWSFVSRHRARSGGRTSRFPWFRELLPFAFQLASCPGTYHFLILSFQSRFRMQNLIRCRRHSPVRNNCADRFQLIMPHECRIFRPLGEVQFFAAFADMVLDPPRDRGDMAIPGQTRLVRMAVSAGMSQRISNLRTAKRFDVAVVIRLRRYLTVLCSRKRATESNQ